LLIRVLAELLTKTPSLPKSGGGKVKVSKAFRNFSLAAAATDTDECQSSTKCLAVLYAVALCLQVTSDLVLPAVDGADGGSKYVPDAMSAEHDVGVIESLLPSMLQTGEPRHKSIQSEKACAEVEQILMTYSDISGTSEKGKESAINAAAKIKAVSGAARLVLEINYDF